MICKNCQKEIKDDAKFCNFCGEKIQIELTIASFNKRILNLFIDTILSILFVFLFAFVLGYILAFLGLYKEDMFNDESFNQLLVYLSTFIYYLIFEFLFGKTPAKYFTRTKVVTELGDRPNFLMIFKRSLFRFVLFDVFSFSGKYPIGWHDKWSKTRVVRNNIYK